jgi:hypothetical protein
MLFPDTFAVNVPAPEFDGLSVKTPPETLLTVPVLLEPGGVMVST